MPITPLHANKSKKICREEERAGFDTDIKVFIVEVLVQYSCMCCGRHPSSLSRKNNLNYT